MYSDTIHKKINSEEGSEKPQQIRIGELVRAAGVSRETIHFYLREGLLPPPHKVNARVSYFDAGHLARLQIIKRMRQAHLPLPMIREHLEAVQGLPAEQITRRILPKLVEHLNLDGEEPELSAEALAEYARLTRGQLAQLEAFGVLRPAMVDGRQRYTHADADAAAAARLLLDQGVELDALRFFQRHVQLIEQEHGFILHHLILPALVAGRRDQVSAGLGLQGIRQIEAYLRRQFRRQFGMFGEAALSVPDPLDDSAPYKSAPEDNSDRCEPFS